MKGYQTARAVRARGAFFYDLHHGRTMTKGGGGGGGLLRIVGDDRMGAKIKI